MSDRELTRRSFDLGRKAHKRGLKPILVLDPEAMRLVNSFDTRDRVSLIMQHWLRGWQAWNLGAAA